MDDRIRLAEAMFEDEERSFVIGKNRELMWLTDAEGKAIGETIRPIPDPFTDANDDFAVLEWFRAEMEKAKATKPPYSDYVWNLHHAFCDTGPAITYQIGDYARAAHSSGESQPLATTTHSRLQEI